MTNQDAIKLIEHLKEEIVDLSDNEIQALDLAIKALEENERLSLLYSDMANEIARLKSMTGER